MSTPTPANRITVGSISDRGLSEKRPVNEDSYLADPAHGIFAVADGVGGAEAGEVASQTAIDVLQEAFRHQLGSGDDVEDLMELSIQRANSSIHQMASESPRFSMMATTIVALHLARGRATIGHVGDSRLYRLDTEGSLTRETEDHSIVQEEVRAGRMTPEQAANHPSKNVISRALGAEDSVEVDMKTIEFEEGTQFLLCTDGITRHIPDNELRELLLTGREPEAICAEMKERCYQRGAEDNLTAVIVQAGTPIHEPVFDDERTLDLPPTEQLNAPATHLTPASRIAFPAPTGAQTVLSAESGAPTKRPSVVAKVALRLFVFLLFITVAIAAFFGGIIFRSRQLGSSGSSQDVAPTPSPLTTQQPQFEQDRAVVDSNPQKWLADNANDPTKAMESKDPRFLYFYGRALMLDNKHQEAVQAFELALSNLRNESKATLPLGAEVRLAEAAAALKSKVQTGAAISSEALLAEQKTLRLLDELLGVKTEDTVK